MDSLTEHIATFIRTQAPQKKYLLAYSGGLDSHVLLHLFATIGLEQSLNVRAMYVNHGMSVSSEAWARHCARVCDQLNVGFLHQKICPDDRMLNLEEQLRQSRYQLFQTHLAADEILLTAHHQTDQAETILLQLCRGAGPQGLSAMPRMKPFGQGFHARPLLDFTRETLLHYANHHQLNWIEDESNANSHFTRNFLRHEVMPILKKRWPSVTKALARSAEHCADAQQFIEINTRALLQKAQGRILGTLSVKKVLTLTETEQRQVFRVWIHQAECVLPSTAKLQHMVKSLLQAREDKQPSVQWGNAEIRRYRDDLYVMKTLKNHNPKQVIPWDVSEPLIIPHIGTLKPKFNSEMKNITVRFRTGGETLQLPGRPHHHELKKLFQQWGVPPWMRDRIPLVYWDEVFIGVVGYAMREGWVEFIANSMDSNAFS